MLLWTKDPRVEASPDYLEIYLCRDVYHCTPVQLAEVPFPKILRHLTTLETEQKIQKRLAKK